MVGLAVLALLLARAASADAGIVLPEPVRFGAEDLATCFISGQANDSASSSRPNHSQPAPSHDDQQQRPAPFEFLKCQLLSGSGSSSGASSSAGGGTGTVLGLPNETTTLAIDDSVASQLAADRALSLPNPPGTELFRPPRNGS